MAYFVEMCGSAAFTTVGGVDVPLRSLWGPHKSLQEAAAQIDRMTGGNPREQDGWQIVEIEGVEVTP